MTEPPARATASSHAERRALRAALWLNVALAVSLFVSGLFADSSGLIANALDNTSDAAVYALSYYAVGRGAQWKARAARVSGVMLIVLSVGVLIDVARRFIAGAEPVSGVMIAMTLTAAVINLGCLKLLQRLRHQDVNLRAAWTFSVNDFVSNLGVLVAGALVAWLHRPWPDLVVGLGIARRREVAWRSCRMLAGRLAHSREPHRTMKTNTNRSITLAMHAKLFRGLADPARLALLLRLRKGRCSAGDLARDCGLSPSNASNHLQCLWECGLVQIEPRGRQNVYRVGDQQVLRLLDASTRILASRAGGLIDACRNYGAVSRRALRTRSLAAKRAGGGVILPRTSRSSERLRSRQ